MSAIFADGVARSGSFLNKTTSQITMESIFQDKAWFGFTEPQARSLVRQGHPKPTIHKLFAFNSYNTTKMIMTATYTGYKMSASNSWFASSAVVLLLTHALMALVHTMRTIIWVDSGDAGDTILELVVLAQNSFPPDQGILYNTSSGVQSLETFKLVAWVKRSQREPEGPRGEEAPGEGQLELVISKTQAIRDPVFIPEHNKLYN